MRHLGVDVAGDHVGLDPVAIEPSSRARVVDGVQQREQLAGTIAVAERGERHDRPDGRVRVLTAVLADARRIALHVARIPRGADEGRGEQQDDRLLPVHQIFFDRVHGARGAVRVGRPGEDGPRLRDRVDTALRVLGRAQRSAVVEVRPPIPVAVPAGGLQRPPERIPVRAPHARTLSFAAGFGDRRPLGEGRVQEPAEPDALAPALGADSIHPIVPVAGADQRQAVAADREAPVERACAVLEERGALG